GFEPASCSLELVLYGGETDIVLALEYPSGIDSAGAISQALLDNGRQVLTVHALQYPCINAAQVETLWVMLGTLPASHSLSQAEGELLRDLNVGGMSIYIEGSNTWNIDLPTPFSMYDGVDDNPTGFSTCLELTGVDSGFGLDLSGSGWDADYSNDYPSLEASDHLAPATTDLGGPDAGPIWLCDDGTLTHNSGIFYDSFFGNVIAQSWEFGGYGGDQTALAAVYADALKGISAPAPFLRGDCNSDGSVDIADAIHFLGFLFPPSVIDANGISCRDGCDTNDSGSLDVADAVFLLSHLFAGSGPPPTPYPLCGTDPTSDGLGCAVYNACP
ncbi:MAG: hypothetical protein ACE5GW_02370, partial [Planctomycetota bacterium]